jgi:serine/threonine-protein kinase
LVAQKPVPLRGVAVTSGGDRAPGQVIAGKFRLLEKLGEGGMGSVWLAQHLTLKNEVAVKFMDGAFANRDETALKRFQQEATAAAAIQSPHVVKILDYGNDTSGRPYLAMELLRGEDLDHRLARGGALPLEVVQQIVVETCKGLASAHAAGVVHRDLKPENIFLCKEPDGFSVRILDFGIARADRELAARGNLTLTGQLLGTPMYMSPEQALGKKVIDGRSDLYSLAVVAFQCLTGTTPYTESETVGEIIVAITTQPPIDAATLRDDLPPQVVRWLERGLAKKPEDRFQDAKAMSDGLAEAMTARKMTITMSGFDVDDTLPPRADFDSMGIEIEVAKLAAAERGSVKRDPARQAVTQRDVDALPVAKKKRRGLSPGAIVAVIVLAALIVGTGVYLALHGMR